MAQDAPKPPHEEHVEVVQISSANGSGKPSRRKGEILPKATVDWRMHVSTVACAQERVTARYRELVEKMCRIQRREENVWNSSTASAGKLKAVGTYLCVTTGTSTP